MKKKVPLEADTKKAIKKTLLELSPVVYQIMPATGYGGSIGIPDHIACLPVIITQAMVGQTIGAFLGIEAKRPKGEMHGLQPLNIAQITAAGGFAQVVYSKEGAEVMKQQIIERFKLCTQYFTQL